MELTKAMFTRDRTETVPNRTGRDRILFTCMELFGTRCLHGIFLELVRNESNAGPAKQRVQVQKGYPVRFSDRIRLEPVSFKHSLRPPEGHRKLFELKERSD